MSWLKLIIKADALSPEAIEEVLESIGAEAVSLEDAGDQPLLEPKVGETPLWNETLVTGLFPADQGSEVLSDTLIDAWPASTPPDFQLELLQDRDWSLAWSDHARPMAFGDRLLVLPGDEIPEAGDDRVILRIPPGLAFGTGTHPTTAMCMEWLARTVAPGERVVDYGCGSGILAVAAARLGASEVIGVDNDPQALTATVENARNNDVGDRVRVYQPDECPDQPADRVVANILANPLIELAPRLGALLRPGAWIALTGILDHQAESVTEAYAPWVPDMDITRDAEWVLLTGRKA